MLYVSDSSVKGPIITWLEGNHSQPPTIFATAWASQITSTREVTKNHQQCWQQPNILSKGEKQPQNAVESRAGLSLLLPLECVKELFIQVSTHWRHPMQYYQMGNCGGNRTVGIMPSFNSFSRGKERTRKRRSVTHPKKKSHALYG